MLTAANIPAPPRFTATHIMTPIAIRHYADTPPSLPAQSTEAADMPFDINERITLLQELQQFRDDNVSAIAASSGNRDVPVTSTSWIPKLGDLVCEKIAVKKEFGLSYRAPVPVLGIHSTRTIILPPLPGSK
ncbi:hypothetical protein NDU88_005926 [Pleurodeles waltl]|uniref:Uncharacterized protein n=1 Tax=Pleurodeles waltl TaxID=8319 RepID=A0AAV7WDB7_PLEWA|nr:hypothetical protein NDU88_005926 [Pleurodeles waltl]